MEAKPVDQKLTPQHPTVIEVQPPSPRYTGTSSVAGAPRKIAIPVDLSDESAYAVRWAVQNYLRPGDAVTLVHVRPTSVLYGADWGSTHFTTAAADSGSGDDEVKKKKKLEDDFDSFTAGKIAELAQPLVDAKIGFKVHVVKDHDMKERLCLEIERLGMSVVIMGSRGFGASRRDSKARLGSVSDYCVHHCICPVVVVRYPEDTEPSAASLHPVPEEDPEPETEPHDVSKLHLHSD
ncbi:universal stress protein PHOS32-like [Silene latifolia]|uniref:universal stress protein PHOS32-like n=1 Tax=Silene latifolia TaxID=37657 RepID=UPI003D7874CB